MSDRMTCAVCGKEYSCETVAALRDDQVTALEHVASVAGERLAALEQELARKHELLERGIAEAEHIAIAGSYDNLVEGRNRIINWLTDARTALQSIKGERA